MSSSIRMMSWFLESFRCSWHLVVSLPSRVWIFLCLTMPTRCMLLFPVSTPYGEVASPHSSRESPWAGPPMVCPLAIMSAYGQFHSLSHAACLSSLFVFHHCVNWHLPDGYHFITHPNNPWLLKVQVMPIFLKRGGAKYSIVILCYKQRRFILLQINIHWLPDHRLCLQPLSPSLLLHNHSKMPMH